MAVLASSGVSDLRQKFYELLTDFSTFPASQNFFLVNIKHLPESITEATVNELGLRPGTGETSGLDFAKNVIFKKYFNSYMFLATGVDLTTETTTVNNKGTLINGLLPVGPFMESRDYPDNDLDIQFSETNISIIDSIFRSWIQLYSVYGNIVDPGGQPLSTDISIYFISKQTEDSGFWSNREPAITKIYTYKDCIPYVIKSANVGQYNGDVELGSVAVGFRFSRYDVRIPVQGYVPPAPPDERTAAEKERDAIARIPEEALYGSGEQPYDFTGEVPIYPADYAAEYDRNNPPPDSTVVVAGEVVYHQPQAPPHIPPPEPDETISEQSIDFYPTGTNQYGETTGVFLTDAEKIAFQEEGRRMNLQSKPNVPATEDALKTFDSDAHFRDKANKQAEALDAKETKIWEKKHETKRDQNIENLGGEGTGITPVFKEGDNGITPINWEPAGTKKGKGGSNLMNLSKRTEQEQAQGNIKAFQKEVGKKLADVPSLIEQQVEIFKKNPKNVASQLAKAAGDINQFAKNTMKSAEQFGGLKSVKLLDPKFKLPGNKDEDPGG
jgi:hypothetical protein